MQPASSNNQCRDSDGTRKERSLERNAAKYSQTRSAVGDEEGLNAVAHPACPPHVCSMMPENKVLSRGFRIGRDDSESTG